MSLRIFVQSRENHWYLQPVIYRPQWFICWDNYNPIELVIRVNSYEPEEILSDLSNHGWPLSLSLRRNPGPTGSRIFVPGTFNFAPAISVFLDQEKNGPPDALLDQSDRVVLPHPLPQGCYFFNRATRHRPR